MNPPAPRRVLVWRLAHPPPPPPRPRPVDFPSPRPRSPTAEAVDLKSIQCGFESRRGHFRRLPGDDATRCDARLRSRLCPPVSTLAAVGPPLVRPPRPSPLGRSASDPRPPLGSAAAIGAMAVTLHAPTVCSHSAPQSSGADSAGAPAVNPRTPGCAGGGRKPGCPSAGPSSRSAPARSRKSAAGWRW